MKKSQLMRILGGAAVTLASGAALLAVSGMANGLEAAALTPAGLARSPQAPMLVAQADAMSASSNPEAAASSQPDALTSSQPDAAASAPVSSQPQAAPASTPVTYTAEQADRGKKVFSSDCEECHGKDLRGGLLGGPPLRGLSFEDKYAKGSPAGVLYEFMTEFMPPNDPGRYSPSVYADLMAHILKVNGFKAGAELPSDVDVLYNMTIEK